MPKPIEKKLDAPTIKEAPANGGVISEDNLPRLGLNLVPQQSRKDLLRAKKVYSWNAWFAGVLMIVVMLSVAVLVADLLVSNEYTSKSLLAQSIEGTITASPSIDKLKGNSLLNERLGIFGTYEGQAFSQKKVIDYLSADIKKYGKYSSMEINDAMAFKVVGECPSVDTFSKMWHYLSNDENLTSVHMQNVSKVGNTMDFTLEGSMKPDTFKLYKDSNL